MKRRKNTIDCRVSMTSSFKKSKDIYPEFKKQHDQLLCSSFGFANDYVIPLLSDLCVC